MESWSPELVFLIVEMRRHIREHRRGRGVVAPASKDSDEPRHEPPFEAERVDDVEAEPMGPPLVARPQDRSSLPPQERLLCVAEPPRGADRMPREEQGGQSLAPTPIEGRACGLPGETVAATSPSAFGDPLEEVEEEPAVTRPRVAIDGWVETELELPAHEPTAPPEPRSVPTRVTVQAEPV